MRNYNQYVLKLYGYKMSASSHLDRTFSALADPTRRAILARLASERSVPVGELAKPFEMSQPAISKHLKVLEAAGLISRRREATRRPARIEPAPLETAQAWIETYRMALEANFGRLDALLEELNAGPAGVPKRKGKSDE